jgi:dCMP deaminase
MGINMNESTQEGKAFEDAASLYNKDVKDHIQTNEWEKMSAMVRGENYVEPEKPKAFERIDKINYYLDIAKAVSMRGTCLRRKFGAVIVKNDRIVSTGYVGAPRGRKNCSDIGTCFRMEHNIPRGCMYEKCRSIHAEMNAIISADKEELEGSVLYLTGIENDGSITENADCCAMCKRTIINAGIAIVVIRTPDGYKPINVDEWIEHDDSLDLHEGY